MIFRIDTTDPATPRLMAAFNKLTDQPTWQVLADNIEDLQIAIILTDGTICNSSDDPTSAICDPRKARAICPLSSRMNRRPAAAASNENGSHPKGPRLPLA